MVSPAIRELLDRALAEDIGAGDITSELTVPESLDASGTFFARQDCVIAGTTLLPELYQSIELLVEDGTRVIDGTPIAHVRGKARRLLTLERTALNLLQRLSGIATLTRQYVDAMAGTNCRLLDTRKTIPGLRALEKMATKAGGATNHRMGLYDAVLIKNNHISAAGSVTNALKGALGQHPIVEIEVRTWDELNEALDAGATRLLLDNLTPAEARRWIEHVAGRASCEISGGVTLATIRPYAEAGADFVSVGALTHSATAVDLNFRLTLLP
ncbi:MAG: carboxylating nicotinate-nucleotide diphosphorylase [Acidobacteria bacterium]|nr:carboxylating nicotinate-nucleotide diphosphorylase [Acidobacteriota bacterium]